MKLKEVILSTIIDLIDLHVPFSLCTPTWAYFSKTTFDLCQGLWWTFLSPTTRLVILTVLLHSHVISNIWNAISSRPLIISTFLHPALTDRGVEKQMTTELIPSLFHSKVSILSWTLVGFFCINWNIFNGVVFSFFSVWYVGSLLLV